MRCISCGLTIGNKYHVTNQGNVCDRCWNDPNLFFPEKLEENGTLNLIQNIFQNEDDPYLDLPVLKLQQKDVSLYSGKLDAINLLKLYGIASFEEYTLSGYQRDINDNQTDELSKYILECPLALMPGLFVSIRGEVSFNPFKKSDDFGLLRVPLKKGALWVIDGQHRIGGFEKIFAQLGTMTHDERQDLITLQNYEVPITFVDSTKAIRVMQKEKKLELTEPDIEKLAFFIINKTQRRLSPSLKDTLQYCISRVGIRGVPAIEKEYWRTEAAAIGIDLNSNPDSPWYQKINISGQRGLERPLQLNSFVSSLAKLYQNKVFLSLSHKEKQILLNRYWSAIRKINIDAFSDNNYRNYILTKTIGVYTLNLMLLDYLLHREESKDILDEHNISEFVNKLQNFDWSKESSPLVGYGGMKGVIEARLLLLDYMGYIETYVG
ncbi:MAG: DGQHR domain-containing protein [Promethearchaeota archaeon]